MKTIAYKKICVLIITLVTIMSCEAQIVYTDVIPDTNLICPCGFGYCSKSYNIDLNHDGNSDFTLTGAYWWNIINCSGNMTWIDFCNTSTTPLDSNQNFSNNGASTEELFYNDTIDSQLAWLSPPPSNLYLAFHYQTQACATPMLYDWIDTSFLALKLKVGNLHYFGWARVACTYGGSYFTVFDYAYNSTPNQFILAGDTGTNATGIAANNVRNQISIYPNPFSISTTLAINSPVMLKNTQLKIYDLTGRKIKDIEINYPKTEIKRENLSSGIYFYQLQNGKEIIGTGKLVVR